MNPTEPNLGLLAAMPAPTETPQPPWLLSFADLVSLILCSFVLLYSLVAVDRTKFEQILAGVPGRQVAAAETPTEDRRAMEPAPLVDGRNTDYLASLLKAKLERETVLANVVVEGQGDRVLLRLTPRDLLSVGASGTAPGESVVFALAGALSTLPNRIAVEVRPNRPAEFAAGLRYAISLAERLEGAGASGPIAPRARLTAPGENAGIDVIVFDKALAPAEAQPTGPATGPAASPPPGTPLQVQPAAPTP